MKRFSYNIAIIGGGCIGSSILHELCCRGMHNAILIDHGRFISSATANSGGMIRVFHEGLEHLELALENLGFIEKYRNLGVLMDTTHAQGSLYFFNKKSYSGYKPNLSRMEQAQYPFEVLTAHSGHQNFPQFRWSEDEWAIYEPLGCQLIPHKFMNDLLISALQQGATVLDDCEIKKIRHTSSQFLLYANGVQITANVLVLAGGYRIVPRFRDLGLIFPLQTKTLTTYLAQNIDLPPDLPNYFDRQTLEFGAFGHQKHVIISNPDSTRLLEKKWGTAIRKFEAKDAYAPNRMGYAGQVPGQAGLFLATGWGGTAFKFALNIGHRVAHAIEKQILKGRICGAQ